MKKSIITKSLLTATLLSFIACSPVVMVTDTKYEETVEVEGKTKTQLFGMSNEWMVRTFTDAKSVIQFSNIENGTIAGKYLMYYSPPGDYSSEITFYSIITIRVKDDFAQITIDPQGSLPRYMGMIMYTEESMTADAQRLIQEYKTFLKEYQEF